MVRDDKLGTRPVLWCISRWGAGGSVACGDDFRWAGSSVHVSNLWPCFVVLIIQQQRPKIAATLLPYIPYNRKRKLNLSAPVPVKCNIHSQQQWQQLSLKYTVLPHYKNVGYKNTYSQGYLR